MDLRKYSWNTLNIFFISLLSLALSILLLWALILVDQHLTWLDDGLELNQTEFTESDAATPPPPNSTWYYREIPDDWKDQPHSGNSIWYRFRLYVASPPRQLWGIYLPVIQQNASVWLNGELLGDGGSFNNPLARNWNRPLYFSIPRGLIRAGENLLQVRVKSTGNNNGLIAPVFLAPAESLYPGYRMKYFFRYTLLQFIILSLVFSALLLFTLFSLRPADRLYAWFAFTLTVFVLYSLKFIIIEPPLGGLAWDRLNYSALIWLPSCSTGFIQRFIGQVNRNIELLFLLLSTLVTLILLMIPESWVPRFTASFVTSLALIMGGYPIYRLIHYLVANPRRDTFLLMTGGFLLGVFGIHDWLAVNGFISRIQGLFLPYSSPPGLILFAYILMRRFVQASNESERLNRTLQQEIERKHRELEDSFEQMRELERRNAITEERSRLMRDMHDGMGGHLVSLLSRVEDERSSSTDIARELRRALDDLRLMIDSMEDVEGDLLSLLAMLRDRIEPRLKSTGIRLVWKARNIPPLENLSPEKALHILRIFQEAFTNMIKHSKACRVTMDVRTHNNEKGQCGILID